MNHIFISGITPIEAYPKDIREENCKQYVEEFILCVPEVKPEIEEINEIYINVSVEVARLIDTVLGPKLIIEGKVEIKAVYTAYNQVQSVHSAHWEKKFYNYVLFPYVKEKSYNLGIKNVFIGIEDVCVSSIKCRDLNLSIIFILCGSLGEERGCYPCKGCSYEDNKCSGNMVYTNIYPAHMKLLEHIDDGLDCNGETCSRDTNRKRTQREYEEREYEESEYEESECRSRESRNRRYRNRGCRNREDEKCCPKEKCTYYTKSYNRQ